MDIPPQQSLPKRLLAKKGLAAFKTFRPLTGTRPASGKKEATFNQNSTRHVPRRLTQVALSPVRRTDAPTRSLWKCGISCYAIRDIRSIGEQSGRPTGRLRSTPGLQAMPSEGRHSWHSGAHTPPLSSPGRVTLSVDCGQGVAAGRSTPPPPPPAIA